MVKTLRIRQLTCQCVSNATSHIATTMLLPMPVDGAVLTAMANKYGTHIVAVTNMDWDNDLTPWPAPNVPRTEPPFKGLAHDFLDLLLSGVLPQCRAQLPTNVTDMRLLGISLSGLFTTWAWCQPQGAQAFSRIASISGSFWFPGFVEWVQAHVGTCPKGARCYFSLGNKEGGSRGPREFAEIQSQTRQVVEIFDHAGLHAQFQQTQGTHFAPIEPRISLALEALCGRGV